MKTIKQQVVKIVKYLSVATRNNIQKALADLYNSFMSIVQESCLWTALRINTKERDKALFISNHILDPQV